ncbi:MAG: methyltransferase [Polyangiaceae bacterium]
MTQHDPAEPSGSDSDESSRDVTDVRRRRPSPPAAEVECTHAATCGGCPLIENRYDDQLTVKRGRVVKALSRYPSLELCFTETVSPAEPRAHYRTRAKLVVGSEGRVGLYAKGGGHQVLDIPDCRVLSPAILRVTEVLRQFMTAAEAAGTALSAYESSGKGTLRAVDIRELAPPDGPAGILLTLVVVKDRAFAALADLEAAAARIREREPSIVGVALNFHDGDSPQILGSETRVVSGVTHARDYIGSTVHLATYGSFVQAHRGQAAKIHELLVQVLGTRKPGTRILDLYGGSGAVALALAKDNAKVELVESFAPAVELANRAAREANVSVNAKASDVGEAVQKLVDRGERFDGAVINPPRRGMAPEARRALARLGIPVLAYVSCEPETLCRDLDHLARLGYVATQVRPFDMIPLTEEVETVVVLRQMGAPAPRVLFEDEEILAVEKGGSEGLDEADPTSLTARVRKHLAPDAVHVPVSDHSASGIALFVRNAGYREAWLAAMQAPTTRQVYLAGVRGVVPNKGAIQRDLREGGTHRSARTRYRRLAIAARHSFVRAVPEGVHPHQVRRHLAAIGHPVLGDARYGHAPTNRFFEEKNGLDRACLHIVRVEFDHPTTGSRLVFDSPLSGDLRMVLERLGGEETLRFLENKQALGQAGQSSPPSQRSLAPDSFIDIVDRGSALELDSSPHSIRPLILTDDDET